MHCIVGLTTCHETYRLWSIVYDLTTTILHVCWPLYQRLQSVCVNETTCAVNVQFSLCACLKERVQPVLLGSRAFLPWCFSWTPRTCEESFVGAFIRRHSNRVIILSEAVFQLSNVGLKLMTVRRSCAFDTREFYVAVFSWFRLNIRSTHQISLTSLISPSGR